MTWEDALTVLILHTSRRRFGELCADANLNTEQRDAYRDLVIRLADPTAQPAAEPHADRALQDYIQAHPCGSC